MSADTNYATNRLLAAAKVLDSVVEASLENGDARQSLEVFTQAYRDWTTAHPTIPGAPTERMEKVRLLMSGMSSAGTLGAALAVMLRYGRLVLGDLAPAAIEDEGEAVAIRFERPIRSGPVGLISELWLLYLSLSELEFLTGGLLDGVWGRVRSPAVLPAPTAALLFDRPLTYEAATLALFVPKRHLKRVLVATLDHVSNFQPNMLPAAFGQAPVKLEMATVVGGMLRTDKLRESGAPSSLAGVAERLGCSPATVRRRLALEGSSFRQVRDHVYDELAKHWLSDRRIGVDMIAERLGYTDVFAFRRSFKRVNGCTPTVFRRQATAQSF